ncbi:uncharacterized protein LOC115627991 [Scaptodrosophila lebanonensis]|uniref:Uncharacterized protein LOC115627991 n=1 Tax=Drosophila lebanonensis TaxID=7225 RepID=A0A6J2TT35_DROLE|nr:uncharacterized protein LOC115627991 [Scaptodrosophila lebanonensis]
MLFHLPALIFILHCLLPAWVCGQQQGDRAVNDFDGSNRNVDLDQLDSNVDPSMSLEAAKSNQLVKNAPIYADYDYYWNARRMPWQDSYGAFNELSSQSASTSNLESSNKLLDALPYKSFAWYGRFFGKPISTNSGLMYPSRSYDPYIRRYDRYDEQYHRAYPQYFEDMYVNRQRFDPHDSYSPRVPQFPEPYNMYPDRYLDTPHPREYGKYRRGYLDAVAEPYGTKYRGSNSKLPPSDAPPRNQRVIYYAHLPEIVRTSYDDRKATGGVMSPLTYKLNKKLMNLSRPLDTNSTNYKL